MKTKKEYTGHEAISIMQLLNQRLQASESSSKRLRKRLRNDFQFFISDFNNNFTAEQFDQLIQDKIISVKEEHKDFYEKEKMNHLKGDSSGSPLVSPMKTTDKKGGKDEDYVLDLCDKVLGRKGSRQHKFDFLLGDPGKNGTARKLPVDIYYEDLNLVIEYWEKQHTESIKHFDKPDKMTVSGVSRGEQRKLYDQRRRKLLPENGITLIEIDYSELDHSTNKRLKRSEEQDLIVVREKLAKVVKKENSTT